MSILNTEVELSEAERAARQIDQCLTSVVSSALDKIARINTLINRVGTPAVIGVVGAKAALMASAYNQLVALVESTTGKKPVLYESHPGYVAPE